MTGPRDRALRSKLKLATSEEDIVWWLRQLLNPVGTALTKSEHAALKDWREKVGEVEWQNLVNRSKQKR